MMNRKLILGGLIFGLAVQMAWAAPRVFDVDPVHSSVTFTVRHLYTPFTGRFNAVTGTVVLDTEDLASLKIVGEVDVLGVDTANERRDDHLRTPDFFDVPNHPTARFESTRVTPDADGQTAEVLGKLTLRGTTREVTMRLEFGGYGIDHREGRRLGFRLTGEIPRSEFGVSYNTTLPNGMTVLGENVSVTIAVQAIETVPATLPQGE